MRLSHAGNLWILLVSSCSRPLLVYSILFIIQPLRRRECPLSLWALRALTVRVLSALVVALQYWLSMQTFLSLLLVYYYIYIARVLVGDDTYTYCVYTRGRPTAYNN